ncbi:metallophosphoesterase [Rudanella paleaurantiibacter]|uniref:Metallophosphoesterase n=1 Tax=Rudanella paleaurantiibacter TaxID=2614655 RepID=A0A7J5U0N1_9BACT|nr:metallophosphoesterase [Rudanella paleaurantiibacter]KAB7731239.1 metallophosphoesterase [Rudanella paleaurantiibacter]
MKIAFITDLHIGAEGEMPLGIDVRANFLKALQFVRAMKPACLVLGGDLCYDSGDRAVYRWIYEQLMNLPCAWFAIPGNHDDSVMLAEELHLDHHLHGNELYFSSPLEGYPAVFLDSSKAQLSATQWEWLRDELKSIHHNVLVFCHYPVLPANAEFMDTKYPFRQTEKWLETTHDLPCRMQVISGHYHTEAVALRGNTSLMVTPSTYIQIDPLSPEIKMVKTTPAVREIIVSPGGLTSRVHYI